MEGVILGYEAGEGVIRTQEGTRFKFGRSDWKSQVEPAPGQKVDFIAEEGRAREVYLVNPASGAIYSTMSTIEKSEKTPPTAVYLCYAASFLYGFTMIVGVIIAYLSRGGATGKWYCSHFDYQIFLFWKSLGWFLLGVVLSFFFGLGVLIIVATYLWVLFKIIKGWRLLAEGKAVVDGRQT